MRTLAFAAASENVTSSFSGEEFNDRDVLPLKPRLGYLFITSANPSTHSFR